MVGKLCRAGRTVRGSFGGAQASDRSGDASADERVRRFGQLKYSPSFKKAFRGYETIQPDAFARLFEGETLEEVLAYIFGLPATLGIAESCKWFFENVFHLRISDFEVLAELFQWKMEGSEIAGELVVPFKGETMVKTPDGFRPVEGFERIKGGVRNVRSISGTSFLSIGIGLMSNDQDEAEEV
ncbi:hypothetical protein [Frigidibacter mobilis]|uniref:Uncharacterized protein n=1 Tax=Frigidibacter mobilis TaxID=1335048 RepID=A0A159Z125_9RHOB|nr:hypothetical protein [Frigidibacter mobilis]AMY68591.1 hypothetical protein AKL17_1336 [Frigidibacter mobilis]